MQRKNIYKNVLRIKILFLHLPQLIYELKNYTKMGREVRMVAKHWVYPKDDNGNYKPLHGWSFSESISEWKEGKQRWSEGFQKVWFPKGDEPKWKPIDEEDVGCSYEEFEGAMPKKEDYMPDWDETEKTHFQMYEDTTEGTPISPVFEKQEDLARWLADNKASAFGGMTATYEQWLSTIRRGWVPSATFGAEGFKSGVESF